MQHAQCSIAKHTWSLFQFSRGGILWTNKIPVGMNCTSKNNNRFLPLTY